MTTINDGPNTPPPPGPYGGGHSGWNPSPPPRRSSGSWVKWVVGGVIAIILLCLLGAIILAVVGKHNNDNSPKLPPPASVQPVSPDTGQAPASADPGVGTGQYTTEEQQYLTYVHKDSAFVNVQDKDIVGVGEGVCSDLRNGKTVDNEVTILLNNKIPTKQAAELIAGAVVYLCPDQRSKVPDTSSTS